jgi:hypothetical protein
MSRGADNGKSGRALYSRAKPRNTPADKLISRYSANECPVAAYPGIGVKTFNKGEGQRVFPFSFFRASF